MSGQRRPHSAASAHDTAEGYDGALGHDGASTVRDLTAADVAEALAERLGAQIVEAVATASVGALVDAGVAARLLSVPESWLRAEARANRVPHVQLGKYVRFDPEELMAWARNRTVGPRPLRTGSQPVSRLRDAA